MRANRSRLYHAGIPPLKRSTYCDALEKRDYRVFEDLFHAAVNKAQLPAGNRKKRFKDPQRIREASIIPVCLQRFDGARYRLGGSTFVTRMKSNRKYKRQAELFFKRIKQHLKVKSFWGTGENAVWIQLWTALILTVLLWIKRTIDGIMLPANQLLQMMKTTLLGKNSIAGLCTNVSPPPEIPSSQPVWDWAL
jgi:hypothetical protein